MKVHPLSLSLCLFITSLDANAQEARLVPLGHLPGGSFSRAWSLNSDGTVIGGYAQSSTLDSAVRWRVGEQAQVFVSTLSGVGTSSITAMDASGEIVGGSAWEIEWSEAFVWDELNGMLFLPGGSGYNGLTGMSADGSRVVVSSNDTYGGSVAWFGQVGFPLQDIGELSGGWGTTDAGGLSSDGRVVVGESSSSQGFQAYRWSGGQGMQGLGFLPGYTLSSEAHDTNGDGSVIVGYSRGQGSARQAFRWTATGGMQGLGFLPGTSASSAEAVSDDGNVVVGLSGTTPFVWTPMNGMVSLESRLASLGAQCLSGWELIRALSVSADGNAVAGSLLNPFGQEEAYVAFFTAPSQLEAGTRYCSPATPNSTGAPARLSVIGSSCLASDDLVLLAEDLPPNVWGLFISAPASSSIANPLGQGTLCLGAPIVRLNGPGFPSNAAGQASRTLDLPATSIAIGTTWYFQAYYRDQNPSQTSNFTDAVEVMFR